MDIKSLNEKFKTLGTLEKIEDVRASIIDLESEIVKDYESHQTILSERDKYKNDNESLRQANMKLFLQVGSKEVKETKQIEESTDDLKYENLFNEKGELK